MKTICNALILLAASALFGTTVADKKASLVTPAAASTRSEGALADTNEELREARQTLLELMANADAVYRSTPPNARNEAVRPFLDQIHSLREEVRHLEETWKMLSQEHTSGEQEALWNQPDTTIGQIVIDYAGGDCIYLMPPEIAALKVHVSSTLTVPKAIWDDLLVLVLSSYGIGVKQLDPFLKQLYFMRLNQSGLRTLTDSREELELLPRESKIAFIITPPPTETRRVYQFLDKFIASEQMTLQLSENNLVVVGLVKEVSDLLKVYDFIASPTQRLTYRLVTLQKSHCDEISRVLGALFDTSGHAFTSTSDKHMPYMPPDTSIPPLRVIPLKHPGNSLFLIGKSEQITKACEIIHDIERKIGEVQEKTIYFYACKHSESDELAKVLSSVYLKLASLPGLQGGLQGQKSTESSPPEKRAEPLITQDPTSPFSDQPLIVNPTAVNPTGSPPKKATGDILDNFIVDPKTNSIVMVVEAYLLPQLKDLLKKIDVPKKMVQIDVLLFEKKIVEENNFGLNLLKLGTAVKSHHARKVTWNDLAKSVAMKGILQFAITRGPHNHNPFQFVYNFLLSQDGIHINQNPTVTTVNQTTATVALVEEMSINTGVIEIDTTKVTRLKNAYSRAQYGIILHITPTVHAKVEGDDGSDEPKYITLSTDITFDTTHPKDDDRPDVTRRNIKNEVRIADGETVIIGGLRRKMARDRNETIPFLGEIPGIGKFFSTTALHNLHSEMFIFITPKIVPDVKEEYIAMRREALLKRPGDLPEFLLEIEAAKQTEKAYMFERSVKLLIDG